MKFNNIFNTVYFSVYKRTKIEKLMIYTSGKLLQTSKHEIIFSFVKIAFCKYFSYYTENDLLLVK